MSHSPIVASSLQNFLLTSGEKFWVAYLAVPYKKDGRDLSGWDCYGAVRYVLWFNTPVRLKMFDMVSAAEILRQANKPEWIEQDVPRLFDVVVMNVPNHRGRYPLHVGIMVDKNRVLHAEEHSGTLCLPLNHPSIISRLAGFYRHRNLA